MKKHATKKRRKISKAKQQRRKLRATGLAIILLILLIALVVFFFDSCGTNYAEAETNTVYVLENGKVISTDVEAFDEKTYDKDKLQSYVKDSINTYNAEIGKNSLKEKSLKIEDGKAVLVLEYVDVDTYEAVNAVELFVGTVKEAQVAGYKFDASYAKLTDGKAISATAEDFTKSDDYKVVIFANFSYILCRYKTDFSWNYHLSIGLNDYHFIVI